MVVDILHTAESNTYIHWGAYNTNMDRSLRPSFHVIILKELLELYYGRTLAHIPPRIGLGFGSGTGDTN